MSEFVHANLVRRFLIRAQFLGSINMKFEELVQNFNFLLFAMFGKFCQALYVDLFSEIDLESRWVWLQ